MAILYNNFSFTTQFNSLSNSILTVEKLTTVFTDGQYVVIFCNGLNEKSDMLLYIRPRIVIFDRVIICRENIAKSNC